MATTYTWKITAMDCYPELNDLQDVVFNVHWNCVGEDGAYSSCSYGTHALRLNSETPHTPYADLTEDQVLNWIWTNGIDKDVIESNIQKQIQKQTSPQLVTSPLPWTTPESK